MADKHGHTHAGSIDRTLGQLDDLAGLGAQPCASPTLHNLESCADEVSTEGLGTSPIVPTPVGWTYAFWEQTGHAGCERLALDAGSKAGGFRPDSDLDRR